MGKGAAIEPVSIKFVMFLEVINTEKCANICSSVEGFMPHEGPKFTFFKRKLVGLAWHNLVHVINICVH